MYKSRRIYIYGLFVIIAFFTPLNILAQQFSEVQMDVIHRESKNLISQYENYINLMGDKNEPITDREQAYKPHFERLFYENAMVYNDLDPGFETSQWFLPDVYSNNIMLWYRESGFTCNIHVEDAQFKQLHYQSDNKYYVDVVVNKSVSGLYMGAIVNQRAYVLSFRISFLHSYGSVKDFKIAGITKASEQRNVLSYEKNRKDNDPGASVQHQTIEELGNMVFKAFKNNNYFDYSHIVPNTDDVLYMWTKAGNIVENDEIKNRLNQLKSKHGIFYEKLKEELSKIEGAFDEIRKQATAEGVNWKNATFLKTESDSEVSDGLEFVDVDIIFISSGRVYRISLNNCLMGKSHYLTGDKPRWKGLR